MNSSAVSWPSSNRRGRVFTDASIPLQIAVIAIYTAAVLTATTALILWVPELWRAGLVQMRVWLSPDRRR